MAVVFTSLLEPCRDIALGFVFSEPDIPSLVCFYFHDVAADTSGWISLKENQASLLRHSVPW